MKYFYIIIFTLLTGSNSFGQTKGVKPVVKEIIQNSGVTRAVVVGISDYQNKDITDLQYADADAKVFANYLMSPNGLDVDSNNVTLLLNKDATSGQFVSALYGLLEESKEGDLAIIYFSGHGDVESTTISQPGFLLCWDAPARVYMGGGTFGLAYLQEIISTLSLKTKSRVLVITDACRAGKLAGSDIGGSQATAANLSKQYANEVKILSCQPDELSLEGETWGGGRGVFSYYLMAGLQGLADKNDNGEVTLSEIERYLEDNVSEAVAPHSQIPLTVGGRNSVISIVNPDVLAKLKEEGINSGFNSVGSRSIAITKESFVDSTDYDYYLAFDLAMDKGHYLFPRAGSAYELYNKIKDLEELSKYTNIMRRNLAASMQDEAQQAINDYLASDPVELKKRWKFADKYSQFPESLEKAAELLGPDHFFYNTLKARGLYFKGLNYRLEGEKTQNDSLVDLAIKYQDSSLVIEPLAAYALNEKGYAHFVLDNYDDAIESYLKAKKLTPSWALIYSNLCAAYNEKMQYEKAIPYGLKAIKLDSNLIFTVINIGTAYKKINKLDSALFYFNKGLEIDSSYWIIHTWLGILSEKNKDFNKAETHYLKSISLNNHNINTMTNLADLYLTMKAPEKARIILNQALEINPKSANAINGMVEYAYYIGDLGLAKIELIKYLDLFPDDNYAYYLLASIYAGHSDKTNAMLLLEQAFANGFTKIETIEKDKNFKDILETEAYLQLVKKYSKK